VGRTGVVPLGLALAGGFAANFARMRTTDVGPAFIHLWSLAVEQQFYLAWPFWCIPAHGRLPQVGCGCVAAVARDPPGALSMAVGARTRCRLCGRAVYVLPFTQFDAFAAGAAIPVFSLDKLPYAGRTFLAAVAATGAAGLAVLLAGYYAGEAHSSAVWLRHVPG